jgi:hypothetical protein
LYVLAFIGIDFAGYWSHRFNHSINVFWNRHVVHHSSEEFNLACALRQEMSAFVGIYFFLYIPIAFLGVPYQVVAVVAPLHLFAQFWYHTRLIDRMGILEHILVTPSHHRVHHAINEIYLDKNLSQIFIIWDKLFGTFQAELPSEPPIYGTLTPANTWNPVIINFQHVGRLAQDAWRAGSWWDKLRIWFMPLGWRPADVAEKYPRQRPDTYTRTKYDPYTSPLLTAWIWFQFVFCNLLMFHLLINFGTFTTAQIAWYATFLFVSIFAYSALMDRSSLAIPSELVRMALGVGIILQSGQWFGLQHLVAGATSLMLVYLVFSFLLTVYFAAFEKEPSQAVAVYVK